MNSSQLRLWWEGGLASCVVVIVAALALVESEVKAGEIVFDASRPLHRFDGIGVNCWPGEESLPRICDELGIRFARLWVGNRAPMPAADTVEAYQNWWNSHRGNEHLRTTLRLFKERGVKVIAGFGGAPPEWCEGKNKHLRTDRHGSFARFWAATVLHLQSLGGGIHGIELYNEPDGDWSIHVTAEENAAVIKAVRAALDAAGLRSVLVVGPGTAHCDWGFAGDAYVNALDAPAVAALGAWSNHMWEWSIDRVDASLQRQFVRVHWPNVMNSFKRRDPQLGKPVYVTEAGTSAVRFHGRPVESYWDAGKAGASKSDAIPFGIRYVENLLMLANLGANAVLFWEAADQSWSDVKLGLLRGKKEGFTARPAYEALRAFSPELPADARVLTLTQLDPTLYAAAFANQKRILVVVSNGSEATASATLKIQGAERWNLVRAVQFVDGRRAAAKIEWDASAARTNVTLPMDSQVSLVLER